MTLLPVFHYVNLIKTNQAAHISPHKLCISVFDWLWMVAGADLLYEKSTAG